MSKSTRTITVARVADVPGDLAAAFRNMPHYRPVDSTNRDSYTSLGSRWDPLSTQGPDRAQLFLTGYIDRGRVGPWQVYVLRFDRYSDRGWGSAETVFHVLTIRIDTTSVSVVVSSTLHASDDEPRSTRTREFALARADLFTAPAATWRAAVVAHLRENFEPDLADAYDVLADSFIEEKRAQIIDPKQEAYRMIRAATKARSTNARSVLARAAVGA